MPVLNHKHTLLPNVLLILIILNFQVICRDCAAKQLCIGAVYVLLLIASNYLWVETPACTYVPHIVHEKASHHVKHLATGCSQSKENKAVKVSQKQRTKINLSYGHNTAHCCNTVAVMQVAMLIAILKTARQLGLYQDLEQVSVLGEGSIAIPEAMLHRAVGQSSQTLQLDALQLACVHPRATNLPGTPFPATHFCFIDCSTSPVELSHSVHDRGPKNGITS